MAIFRYLIPLSLVFVSAFSASATISQLPTTNSVDCHDASGKIIGCADTNRNGNASASSSTTVTDFWGGAGDSIALMSNGTVWTWGWDDYGVLGNGLGVTMFDTNTAYNSSYPIQVLGPGGVGHLSSIQAIAGGERHNVTLDSNGEVWTWGWNAFGQLGNGITCTSDAHSTACMGTTPAKIPSFTNVQAIASRGYHSLALKNNGTVWAWGYNAYGQLGDGTTTDQHSPVPVIGLTGHGGVTAISGGGFVSAALMGDHTLMAWGDDRAGAIGNGTIGTTGQLTPTSVITTTGLTTVTQIATGWDHMVALDSNGNVWTWGSNYDGELGNGITSTIGMSVPIKVNGLSNVIGVSAGDGSTVVLEANGTVWAWGLITHGDGTPYSYGPTPVQVSGIDHVTLVRARNWQVYALKSDNTVWAWGSNGHGECGHGTVGGNTDTAVLVLFPTIPFTPTAWLYLPLIAK